MGDDENTLNLGSVQELITRLKEELVCFRTLGVLYPEICSEAIVFLSDLACVIRAEMEPLEDHRVSLLLRGYKIRES